MQLQVGWGGQQRASVLVMFVMYFALSRSALRYLSADASELLIWLSLRRIASSRSLSSLNCSLSSSALRRFLGSATEAYFRGVSTSRAVRWMPFGVCSRRFRGLRL